MKKWNGLDTIMSIRHGNCSVKKMFSLLKKSSHYFLAGIEMIKTGKLNYKEKMLVLKLCNNHWMVAIEIIKSGITYRRLIKIFNLTNYDPEVVLVGLTKYKLSNTCFLRILKLHRKEFRVFEKIIQSLILYFFNQRQKKIFERILILN